MRRARSASRQVESEEDAERFRIRLAYWASFANFLDSKNSNFRIRRANKDSWFYFPIGCSQIHINATVTYSKQRIGVELYIENRHSKLIFNSLLCDKAQIEREFGEALEWHELPTKRTSRISLFRNGVDPADQAQYPDLHTWMLDKMERFRTVFADRVKSLTAQAPAGELQDEEAAEV